MIDKFKEEFNMEPVTEDKVTVEGGNAYVSSDQTVVATEPKVTDVGAMTFGNYEQIDDHKWSVRYATVDGEQKSVYTFPNNYGKIAVDADKFERVADLVGLTPAELADEAFVHGYYPVRFKFEWANVVICPVISHDID